MGKTEKEDSSSSSSPFPSFASTAAAGPRSSSSRPSSSAMDDVLGYYMRKKQAYNLRQSGSRSVKTERIVPCQDISCFFAESGVRRRRMRFRRLGSPPSSRGG